MSGSASSGVLLARSSSSCRRPSSRRRSPTRYASNAAPLCSTTTSAISPTCIAADSVAVNACSRSVRSTSLSSRRASTSDDGSSIAAPSSARIPTGIPARLDTSRGSWWTRTMATGVLVVEDDDALREAVAEAIADAGYPVTQAENGRVALDRMREHSPCLVVLDLMMPVLDGWKVVHEMDGDPMLAAIPICVVSAQTRVAPPRNACFLRKPVSLPDLLRTIEEHCGKGCVS